MSRNKNESKKGLSHRIGSFLSHGGLSIFFVLLISFTLILLLMGSGRIIVNVLLPDQWYPTISTTGNQPRQLHARTSKMKRLLESSGSGYPGKIVGLLSSLSGLILLSLFLAYMTTLFRERGERLRRGESILTEENHTVILGFNSGTLEIIKELNETGASQSGTAIVVLAEMEKGKMDRFFNDTLPKSGKTRIVTKEGSTSSPSSLKSVRIERAKTVILLNNALPFEKGELQHRGDSQVLKSILTVLSSVNPEKIPNIVAKLFFKRNRRLAEELSPGDIQMIEEEKILAKILAWASRSPGLSLVYSDLVSLPGNKIYFSPIPLKLCSLTFGEIQFYFKRSIPLGVRDINYEIHLNPDSTIQLSEGDELVLLAADDSAIKYPKTPLFKPKNLKLSKRIKSARRENYLIVGWSNKAPVLINEYGGFIPTGSTIRIVVKKGDELTRKRVAQLANRLGHVKIRLSQVDMRSRFFPRNLHPEKYDSVVILAGEGPDTEVIDSETVSIVLKIRTLFREIEKRTKSPVTTQLITEVMGSENSEMMRQIGVNDLPVSGQLVSKIVAQVSKEPDIKKVYDQLFQQQGSKIYLKSADLYLETLPTTTTFTDLMFAAQKRNEVAFGIKFNTSRNDSTTNYGLRLLPDKDELFLIMEEDQLVVLAENGT